GIVRRLGKLPTISEYEARSKFSVRPLTRLFRTWTLVPEAMQKFAQEQGLEERWKDVIELVEKAQAQKKRSDKPEALPAPPLIADQPVYGMPITGWPLMFAPTNEAGVLFLFGAMAKQLGFLALRIQTGYPDCEAMRVVGGDRLQRV